jgi:4-amino-4-deoxy-L-arabinose transferase-like glycosyltransferase
LDSPAPIRSRAVEETDIQIPLWGVPLVFVVLYVSLFSGLGALGLVGPDEPRYAAIARAMAETHDWVTPRLWGTPWFEKPVLYYWAAGTAMRIFGVNEFAARLPSALGALLAVVAVAWTALRSYGIGAAWYALLMLPTSVAMIGFARAATPDMLFAGTLTAAMAIGSEMLQRSRPGPVLRIAFGFLLGAAVLAKGPAAVILAGGATLLWAALSRQWRAPFRFLHPLVITAFCATALPWYVLCALRNPDFLRDFIWHHNFERYLTPVFQHPQPFWFFGPILLLGILPWTPLVVPFLVYAFRNKEFEPIRNSPSLLFSSWALFALLFFSISQSKLPGYILPAIPSAALLLARSFVRLVELKSSVVQPVVGSIGIVFLVLVGIARAKFHPSLAPELGLDLDPLRGIEVAFGVSLVFGALIVGSVLRRKWNGAICVAACATVILILTTNRMFMPVLDSIVSARPAASSVIRSYAPKPDRVSVFHVPRAYWYGLNYYFQADLAEWAPGGRGPSFLFTSREDLPQVTHLLRSKNGRAATPIPATEDGKIYFFDLR